LKDFVLKTEKLAKKKKGKREYLNNVQTRHLMKQLNRYFESSVEIPRIKVGKKQIIETLINEEVLLLAKFLRDEWKMWIPRIAVLN
jgi:hypothetical protein